MKTKGEASLAALSFNRSPPDKSKRAVQPAIAAKATKRAAPRRSEPTTEPSLPSSPDIYERIIAAILDHQLPPGTKLVEDRLATAFGVSRTRIRPALVQLANERIVDFTPNRGATVAQPTEAEAREVFEVRRMIEPTLVERFIERAGSHQVALLAECLDSEQAAREAGDMRRAIRLSGEFHLRIADNAGHSTLGRILRELISRTSLVLMMYSDAHAREREQATACGCLEHQALLAAIRLRDAREGARLMREHLLRLESQLSFEVPDENGPDLVQIFATAA